ncbi:MAG: hypothetical protein QW112_00875, partial [Candidatus Micrarchaeia archaeon]
MNNIYRQTLSMNDESDAARHLISEISWTMNVNEKISNMFCGWMSNPDIIPSINAWRVGIDWTQFVTIDTMVPRVLKRMGLVPDNASYQNCVYAIRSIARHVDLKRFGFHKYNPMIVEVSIWMLSRKSDGTMQKNSGFCFKEKPDCRGCTVSKSCKKS